MFDTCEARRRRSAHAAIGDQSPSVARPPGNTETPRICGERGRVAALPRACDSVRRFVSPTDDGNRHRTGCAPDFLGGTYGGTRRTRRALAVPPAGFGNTLTL